MYKGGSAGIFIKRFYDGACGADFVSHLERLLSQGSCIVGTKDAAAATIMILSTQKVLWVSPCRMAPQPLYPKSGFVTARGDCKSSQR